MTGRVLTDYWPRIDWVLPTGAHAPSEVTGLKELDDQGRIDAFCIITDMGPIRPFLEEETGRATASTDWA